MCSIIYRKQTVRDVFQTSKQMICHEPNSILLRNLIQKVIVIKAATIFQFSVFHTWCQYAFYFCFFNFSHLNKYCHVLTVWLGVLGFGSFQIPFLQFVLCQLKRSACQGVHFVQADLHGFEWSFFFRKVCIPNFTTGSALLTMRCRGQILGEKVLSYCLEIAVGEGQ